MATRGTLPGSYNSGDPWGTADANAMPGGLIGYAELTSSSSAFTATADVSGLTLTLTPNASRVLRVAVDVMVQSTVANDTIRVFIVSGATVLTFVDVDITSPNFNLRAARTVLVHSPASSSTTWKIQAQRTSGSGTTIVAAAATTPAVFTIEDLGPHF